MFNPNKRYLHVYQTLSAFTEDYNGNYYHEPWVSAIVENDQVDYNKVLKMSVEELIAAGYATLENDYAASSIIHGGTYQPNDKSESNYDIIQIHSNCPVKLENITDFDTWLESATTFVWREELPAGWSVTELAEKYNNAELDRPPMEEMFAGVEMGSVNAMELSFKPDAFYTCDTSILTRRYNTQIPIYKSTPEHVIITIRGGSDHSSVFQTSCSEFKTTKHITFNAGRGFNCHDVIGMFEHNPQLTGLTFNGRWYGHLSRFDAGMMAMQMMFEGDDNLIEIPLFNSDLPRDHEYNWFYPHFWKNNWSRGNQSIGKMFKGCTSLTSIKPTFNMYATRSGASTEAFECPNLTDVHFKNLNNSDWDFTNPNYYIPRMSVESIQYLIDNLSDQQASAQGRPLYWTDSSMTETTETVTDYPKRNNFTITFNDLHQSEIAQSYIDAAAAKGWTIAWNHVNL